MACDKRYGEDEQAWAIGNIADKVHCYAWCAMHFGPRLVTWLALGLAPVASLVDEPWPRSALIDDQSAQSKPGPNAMLRLPTL
jgi:hypothetical protein